MKVGIITFHRAINYGAVLQCWALQKFIRNIGHKSYVLDYRCSYLENQYKTFDLQALKCGGLKHSTAYILSRIRHFHNISKRNEAFRSFQEKHLSLLNIDKVKFLDAIIAGSDQIWNPKLTGGLDDFYLLQNEAFADIKKIAYAVSGEIKCFERRDVDSIKSILGSFSSLSFREKALSKLFFNEKSDEISICVDPTMLLAESDYAEIEAGRLIGDEYLFLYQVVPSNDAVVYAKKFAKSKNLRFVYLNSKFDFFSSENNVGCDVGPSEFLSLIKHASFVVTTSFHGLVFSIIYKRQFAFFKSGKTERQENLLKMVSLESRIINDSQVLNEQIDYNVVHMESISENSKLYLLNSLR